MNRLIDDGLFAAVLWKIHQQVKKEGYIQGVTLGLFRSDYMVHVTPCSNSDPQLGLRQVEFNTFSVAGGAHASNAAELHQLVFP